MLYFNDIGKLYSARIKNMSIRKTVAAVVMIAALGACSQDMFVQQSGNMPADERLAKIHVGQSKNEITDLLGSPSSVVSLDKDTWIYMSSDIKRVAFFAPKETDRNVLVLKFNKNDKLEEFKRISKAHGQNVDISQDATVTEGDSRGFFQKFFGGTQTYAPMGGTAPKQ